MTKFSHHWVLVKEGNKHYWKCSACGVGKHEICTRRYEDGICVKFSRIEFIRGRICRLLSGAAEKTGRIFLEIARYLRSYE